MSAKRKANAERDQDIVRAWHTAALTAMASVGKLPDLQKLLPKRFARDVQDVRAQKETLKAIADAYGLTLKARKKKKKGKKP